MAAKFATDPAFPDGIPADMKPRFEELEHGLKQMAEETERNLDKFEATNATALDAGFARVEQNHEKKLPADFRKSQHEKAHNKFEAERARLRKSTSGNEKKTFAESAAMAFNHGRDAEAFQFLFAHAVTVDDRSARELLGKMGWVTPAQRPGLAVRWGIGIEFNNKGYSGTDLFPIGATQQMATTRGGGPQAQLERFTGELGRRVVEGLRERIERGDFGLVLKEAGAGYNAGMPRGMRGGGGMQNGGNTGQLSPGVTLIGEGSAKDLVKMAEQAGIDVLFVFKVTVSPVRQTNQVSNKTEIQLYNVADPKKPFETGELANLLVQAKRASGRGSDPVDELMEKLFKEIDQKWRLAALPALQPEQVLGRIAALLEQSHQNPLPVLAEIRMYHTRRLLQDDHLLIAYQRKTNEQTGSVLATGTEENRKQAIKPWLPGPAAGAANQD